MNLQLDAGNPEERAMLEALVRLFENEKVYTIRVQPRVLWPVLSALQLAFRHPNFSGPSREIAQSWAENVVRPFSGRDAALLALWERGKQSSMDDATELHQRILLARAIKTARGAGGDVQAQEALDGKYTVREAMCAAAEMLWVMLANVDCGDWTQQHEEWQHWTATWRDYYFAVNELMGRPPAHSTAPPPPPPPVADTTDIPPV